MVWSIVWTAGPWRRLRVHDGSLANISEIPANFRRSEAAVFMSLDGRQLSLPALTKSKSSGCGRREYLIPNPTVGPCDRPDKSDEPAARLDHTCLRPGGFFLGDRRREPGHLAVCHRDQAD